jgi:membrane-bound ClpP family serine protease
MDLLAVIILIVLGLLLLILEFAVIPGITIAGVAGVLMLGISVYIAFSRFGTIAGIATLAFVLIVSPVLIYYFFKSRAGKKMVLDTRIEGRVELIDKEKIRAGDKGKTIGRLAPSGKVRINNEVVEAQSTGNFVDHNVDIKVVKVLSNKVIVEPLINKK